jgi:hypothetical protein
MAGGCTGFEDGAGLAGGFGLYSGPVWPQPASRAAPIMSARKDFTIRITV